MKRNRSHVAVRRILAQAKVLEDELHVASNNASVLNPRVIVLREKVKDIYCSLLMLDLCAAQHIGIEQRLWHKVFYQPIEELRAQIRSEQKKATLKDAGHTATILSKFLKESEEFYSSLIDRLQHTHGNIGVELPSRRKKKAKTIDPAEDRENCTKSCYQSLIYLGDILRYKEISLRSKTHQNFKSATSCYRQATYIWPKSGNPYNQLAVLSLYNADEIGALYNYYRALYSENSFPTAKENLKILFGKKGCGSTTGIRPDNFSFEHCCSSFMQAIGALFTKLSTSDALSKVIDDCTCNFKHMCSMNDESMQIHMASKGQHMVKEIRIVHFFIKVVVISICSIESAILSLDSNENTSLDESFVHHALMLALGIQLHFIQSCKSPSAKVLPAIGIFSSWLAIHKGRINTEGTPGLKKRFKKYTSALICLLRELDVNDVNENELSWCLIEDVELRGFTPIAAFQKELKYGTWPSTQRSKESQWRRAIRLARILNNARVISNDDSLLLQPIMGFTHCDWNALKTIEDREDNIITWKGNVVQKVSLALPDVESEVPTQLQYEENAGIVYDTLAFLSNNFFEKREEEWKSRAQNVCFNVHQSPALSIRKGDTIGNSDLILGS